MDDAGVAVTVCHEDVAVSCDGDVSGTVESCLRGIVAFDAFCTERHHLLTIHSELIDHVVPGICGPYKAVEDVDAMDLRKNTRAPALQEFSFTVVYENWRFRTPEHKD